MTNNFTQPGFYLRRDGGVEVITTIHEGRAMHSGSYCWPTNGYVLDDADSPDDLISYLGKENPLDELARLKAKQPPEQKTLRDEFLPFEVMGFLRALGLDESLHEKTQQSCIEYAQRLRAYTETRQS